jgi:hypothetical protein
VNTHLANTVKNRNLQNCVAKWQIRSKYMRQVHYSLHTINDWLMIKSKFTIKEYYWLNKNIYITYQFTTLVPDVYFYYFHCEGRRKNKPLEPGYQFTGIQSKRVWLNVNELIELLSASMNLFENINCNSAKISECFSVSKFKPTVMMHTSPNKIYLTLVEYIKPWLI